jgi:hypothetical protein
MRFRSASHASTSGRPSRSRSAIATHAIRGRSSPRIGSPMALRTKKSDGAPLGSTAERSSLSGPACGLERLRITNTARDTTPRTMACQSLTHGHEFYPNFSLSASQCGDWHVRYVDGDRPARATISPPSCHQASKLSAESASRSVSAFAQREPPVPDVLASRRGLLGSARALPAAPSAPRAWSCCSLAALRSRSQQACGAIGIRVGGGDAVSRSRSTERPVRTKLRLLESSFAARAAGSSTRCMWPWRRQPALAAPEARHQQCAGTRSAIAHDPRSAHRSANGLPLRQAIARSGVDPRPAAVAPTRSALCASAASTRRPACARGFGAGRWTRTPGAAAAPAGVDGRATSRCARLAIPGKPGPGVARRREPGAPISC